MTERNFVIIGGGLAGAKAAETLREKGFDGNIVVVGDEIERPYERPPLSKGFLLGTEDKASMFVHEPDWYSRNSVELLLGQAATDLDPKAHRVTLSDGRVLPYTKLLIATGAHPNRLPVPGFELGNVFTLRQVEQSESIGAALERDRRVVVIGGGWIGLEVAAAARLSGCEVTVVEPQDTPLRAVLGARMGGFFGDVHRKHGVELLLGRSVTELVGGEAVSGVVLDDGSILPADSVVVAVGVRPRTELADRAGLDIDNGILVDASLRTSDPDIHAAGDVANVDHAFYGRRVRVEHWDTALGSGPAAAEAMLGLPVSYDRLPFFFTDQYDLGMEFVGMVPPDDRGTVITRGDVAGEAFWAFWLDGATVAAAMHVNQWDVGIDPLRELVRGRREVDADKLADPNVPLTQVTVD